MKKQITIANLIVMPLIASAIFLASPALASNTQNGIYASHKTGTETSDKKRPMDGKKGIVGTVKSITGTVIIVTGMDTKEYTVDASSATVMKASTEQNVNPTIITVANISVGDTIMVRGTLDNLNMSATDIFDGKIQNKHLKNFKGKNGIIHRAKN
jgi:hypothetical protein